MKSTFLAQDDIESLCDEMEPAIRSAAHLHNLPYLPLIPSIRAYALLDMSWQGFVAEYRRAVVVAARSGQAFAYID